MPILNVLIYNIIPFVCVLSLLVFVHEFGHYFVARYNGVKIDVFSIGFGPEIFGWTDRHATRWKLSAIPLGGYVKMFSDLNAASQPDSSALAALSEQEKQLSLHYKTVWQRIAVSFAGPAANYLFAILIFGTLYMFVGQETESEASRIGMVMPQGAADQAGLREGDQILTANENPLNTFKEFQNIIRAHPGEELRLTGIREGHPFALTVTPKTVENGKVKVGQLGITPSTESIKRSPLTAYGYAIKDIYMLTAQTLKHIGGMITGQNSAKALSGPLGIAALTGHFAQKGLVDLIFLMGLLSVNLGLINLFPVPMLDGGHLLFYFIEAIRGKPVPEKVQEWGYYIGFTLVMLLVLGSSYNDLENLQVIQFFTKFFH